MVQATILSLCPGEFMPPAPPRGAAALVAAAALLALAPVAHAAAPPKDYAATALNIVPSGQLGSVPVPKGADRQARMYDGLTPLFDKVTSKDLTRYFKSERFGTRGQCPCKVEKTPRRGVRLVRDAFDVPHITGKTADDVTWAAGWVMAEDRGLLLQQARYNARVAAIDAPHLSAIALVSGLKAFVPSAQTEAEVAKQTTVLHHHGKKGKHLLHDIDVYVTGINAYLKKSHATTLPWTRSDVYALNALKGQFLGQGGGDEARRSELYAGLQARLGAPAGQGVFDDLRQRDPADTPASIEGRFPYGQVPASKAGNVVIDPGSLRDWDYGAPAVTRAAAAADRAAQPKTYASNILMVSAKRSQTGHPLFVGGPQIGYYYPGLTLEMDLHGPGIDTRGVTSAPFPGYMLIGRGPDFAWTLTSAGADIIDQFVETLCNGDDTHYLYKGQCLPMSTFDAGTIKGSAGQPDTPIVFRRTVHGPVVGYATVGGTRVAISSKRSSYGKDVLDQLPFQDLTQGRVRNARQFVDSFTQTPQTFNAFYADDRHIAEVTTGLLPLRAGDVDPGLPTNGDGAHEWKGFLSASRHPHQIDPKSGQIVNWNNKVARGLQAADDEWGYGAITRVDLLNRGLAKHAKQTLATVTGAMNAAATQDLRSVEVTPVLARLLASGAPNARDAKMVQLLRAWTAAGSSRLDRNLDGKIDDPGAAVMDAAWPKIADAVMKPVLGPQLDELATLMARFDLPPSGQFGGWQSYVYKDLRTQLGDRVKAPLRTRYCGGGDVAACRASVWDAIDQAGAELEAAQGADPAAWRADANRERIKFVPGLLPYTMRYTNRPSGIQQVISFDGHRGG
jgi:acyl-homoserine lactone acylase PvdQ